MAEVIGLAASVITISHLGIQAIKVSKKLLDFAKNSSMLQDEIEQMADPPLLSGYAIQDAYKSLKGHDILNSSSKVLKHMVDTKIMQSLNEFAKRGMQKLKRFPAELKSIRRGWSFMAAYKWHKKRARFDGLALIIEKYFGTQINATTEQLRREEQAAKVCRKAYGRGRYADLSVGSALDALESLESLSKSMRRESDRLPGIPDKASAEDRGQRNSNHIPRATPIPSPDGAEHNLKRVKPFISATAASIEPEQKIESTQPMNSSDLSSLSRPSNSSRKPTDTIILLYESKIEGSIKGYIARNKQIPSGARRSTKASISVGGGFNHISLQTAKELGLTVLELEDVDPKELQYIGSKRLKVRVVGTIRAAWWHDVSGSAYQRVQFFVTDDARHGIRYHFGTTFQRKEAGQ